MNVKEQVVKEVSYFSKELVRLVFTDGMKEKEAGRIF
jgi:hypothetical protein